MKSMGRHSGFEDDVFIGVHEAVGWSCGAAQRTCIRWFGPSR